MRRGTKRPRESVSVSAAAETTHSSGAALVAVTLPLPAPNVAPGQYMASLDVLSDGLPPTIMLRGNNDNVITFSS